MDEEEKNSESFTFSLEGKIFFLISSTNENIFTSFKTEKEKKWIDSFSLSSARSLLHRDYIPSSFVLNCLRQIKSSLRSQFRKSLVLSRVLNSIIIFIYFHFFSFLLFYSYFYLFLIYLFYFYYYFSFIFLMLKKKSKNKMNFR